MTDDMSAEALAKAEGRAAIEAAASIYLVQRWPHLAPHMEGAWAAASDGQREQALYAAKDILKAYLAALPGLRLVPVGADLEMTKVAGKRWPEEAWSDMVRTAPPPPGLED